MKNYNNYFAVTNNVNGFNRVVGYIVPRLPIQNLIVPLGVYGLRAAALIYGITSELHHDVTFLRNVVFRTSEDHKWVDKDLYDIKSRWDEISVDSWAPIPTGEVIIRCDYQKDIADNIIDDIWRYGHKLMSSKLTLLSESFKFTKDEVLCLVDFIKVKDYDIIKSAYNEETRKILGTPNDPFVIEALTDPYDEYLNCRISGDEYVDMIKQYDKQ